MPFTIPPRMRPETADCGPPAGQHSAVSTLSDKPVLSFMELGILRGIPQIRFCDCTPYNYQLRGINYLHSFEATGVS